MLSLVLRVDGLFYARAQFMGYRGGERATHEFLASMYVSYMEGMPSKSDSRIDHVWAASQRDPAPMFRAWTFGYSMCRHDS